MGKEENPKLINVVDPQESHNKTEIGGVAQEVVYLDSFLLERSRVSPREV